MARMIDMIRTSQVPSNLMHAAARGALSVPPGETIEILVHLALHNKVFGEQARLTLADWDEKAALAAAADPRTSAEVLGYLVSLENLRTHLLPALAENPAVGEAALIDLAVSGARSAVEVLFSSERVKSSPALLNALWSNPNLRPNELAEIEKRLAPLGLSHAAAQGPAETTAEASDEVVEKTVAQFLEEHAAELAAAPEKPFEPVHIALEGSESTAGAEADSQAAMAATEAAAAAAEVKSKLQASEAAAVAQRVKKLKEEHVEKRDTVLQKIKKLDVRGRVNLAVRGGKEERSILIRDGTKLVAIAVLESPKISDAEVENIALQKNVLEAVLRAIPLKRRYAKNYVITRNLVYNPRTPLDLSLGLMKNLLIHDLKNLSGNKEVSETIRKLALRMYKQKSDKRG